MGQPLFGAAGQIRLHFFSLTTRSESFRAGRSGKEIMVFASVCTGSCRPPVWPADMIRICPYNAKKQPSQWDDCLFGAAGQIRTATAHSAYALCAVMPFPLAALARLGRQFESRPSRKKQPPQRGDCFSGADSQIRTGDLILTKDALYLLSYISKYYAPPGGALWRPRRDLNPRPPA